ncbi:hypothetical protein BDA96_01G352700 [Sorghum bicolor]|uniref:Uncharacterized protein n=1 Tax=Sorghum bicolor TaxID=4558 RepID=A0A921S325_SORBI|nr:hypothetical protein BDA96_01G352700 [Sorghum bicolor]
MLSPPAHLLLALSHLRFSSPACEQLLPVLARLVLDPVPLPPNNPSPSPQFQTLAIRLQSYQFSANMNPLRPPSSSSRQRKSGRGKVNPAP